jgi:hypothetical protein
MYFLVRLCAVARGASSCRRMFGFEAASDIESSDRIALLVSLVEGN